MVLVLLFLLTTIVIERRPVGQAALAGLDRFTGPVARRADDFMRATTAAFFVAVFAVGGVYLTPDLRTPSELISWAQLLIAAGIFSRRTMPFSAAGVIALWLIALRDYELFHLLDYLALGIGVAGYLLLASIDNPRWHEKRFTVLFWGVAIALMWSSLEKFAYPDWFYPLVEERPFLTFGLPRDAFIPMAGVAEFTLGFGLIWSPLVRRLSAISLLVIFMTAVYPFGRIDFVGHAMIMAALVLIAADPVRKGYAMEAIAPAAAHPKRRLAAVPTGLAMALVVIASSYWGLHATFFGADGNVTPDELATHSFSPEHPHGPQREEGLSAPSALSDTD
ncbi:hypothetical protein GTW51_23070 [Aurantimonas aggregata]|uniref:DoxX family membrane protein n=1 Tax=Aurantimonas aggregata TaxID=2047720 RepID=A0A6L9MPN5_9HYPH|nr:hypothetical protein [Aurantimonas aggregata]